MSGRSRRGVAGKALAERSAASPGPFVELLRPAAVRELVLELEDVHGTRLRLTLRDGGRWRLAGLESADRAP
jgi:hypothetical protein